MTSIILTHPERRCLARVAGAEQIARSRIARHRRPSAPYDAGDEAHLTYLEDSGLIWGRGWRWRLTPLGRAFLDRTGPPSDSSAP